MPDAGVGPSGWKTPHFSRQLEDKRFGPWDYFDSKILVGPFGGSNFSSYRSTVVAVVMCGGLRSVVQP